MIEFSDEITAHIDREVEGRFYLEVEFSRRVSCPSYGPEAYRTQYVRANWTYGKDQDFATSADGIRALASMVQEYLDHCSGCQIILWRGSNGDCTTIKDRDIQFDKDFYGVGCGD